MPRRSDASCIDRRVTRWHRHRLLVGLRSRAHPRCLGPASRELASGRLDTSVSFRWGSASAEPFGAAARSGSSGPTALPPCVACVAHASSVAASTRLFGGGAGSREGLVPSGCDPGLGSAASATGPLPDSIATSARTHLGACVRCGRAPHGADRPRRLPAGARLRPAFTLPLVGSVRPCGPAGRSLGPLAFGRAAPSDHASGAMEPRARLGGASRVVRLRLLAPGRFAASASARNLGTLP